MKIISKFKDYYDPVAMTWGGGDPKIRYERLEIKNTGPFESREIRPPFSIRYTRDISSSYDQRILIVGERVYGIFSAANKTPGYFLPDETHEIMTARYLKWMRSDEPRPLYYKSPYAVELCRLVGQPVFWIRQGYKVPKLPKWAFKNKHLIEVDKEPPKLCEIVRQALGGKYN